MNKDAMLMAIDAKVTELSLSIEAMKNNLELSQNTVRTQTYQRTHEIHNLMIMKELIKGKELIGDIEKWFISATTLAATRRSPAVVFHDGDDMLAIMDAHPNKSYKDLKKVLDDQGFHLDGHTVRA